MSPADDDGVMVTDRGRSYDTQACATVKPQKSLAHLLRSLSAVLRTQHGRARDCGERLKRWLTDAMQGWRAEHAGEEADCAPTAPHLRDALTDHLRHRCRTDPDKQRWLHQIGRHHARGTLLRFLADPQLEPTHNRAENVRCVQP